MRAINLANRGVYEALRIDKPIEADEQSVFDHLRIDSCRIRVGTSIVDEGRPLVEAPALFHRLISEDDRSCRERIVRAILRQRLTQHLRAALKLLCREVRDAPELFDELLPHARFAKRRRTRKREHARRDCNALHVLHSPLSPLGRLLQSNSIIALPTTCRGGQRTVDKKMELPRTGARCMPLCRVFLFSQSPRNRAEGLLVVVAKRARVR